MGLLQRERQPQGVYAGPVIPSRKLGGGIGFPHLNFTRHLAPDCVIRHGVARVSRQCMRNARFGRIVNVTSLVTRPLPFRSSYAAAKSAVESLTRTMAVELASDGITANALAPGPTETELFRENNPKGSEGEKRYLARVPMRRFASPHEIAAAIAFLAGDSAGFIAGQRLFVDGGANPGMIYYADTVTDVLIVGIRTAAIASGSPFAALSASFIIVIFRNSFGLAEQDVRASDHWCVFQRCLHCI
jgi:hypothetical protein